MLDLLLPTLLGYTVCRRVRQVLLTPIIHNTARHSDIHRVSGLDTGAEHYIVKPFALQELLARLRALLRHFSIQGTNNTAKQTTLKYRDLVLTKTNRVVRRGDTLLTYTKRTYTLLLTLNTNVNVVLARHVLLSKVWGYNSDVTTLVVHVYVR